MGLQLQSNALAHNMQEMIEFYNSEASKWERWVERTQNVDAFVSIDSTKIKWTDRLKAELAKGKLVAFAPKQIRDSLYRPFTKSNLYFDKLMNQRTYVFPSIFPTPETELDNRVIWLKVGQEWPMFALMVDKIPEALPQGASQCFPFYTYNEDGTNRRENITDWALTEFQTHYARRHHNQMGHLSLYLRTPASSRLSRKVSGKPQARPTAYPFRRRLLGGR